MKVKTHIVQVTLAVNYNKDAKELFALIDIFKKINYFFAQIAEKCALKKN